MQSLDFNQTMMMSDRSRSQNRTPTDTTSMFSDYQLRSNLCSPQAGKRKTVQDLYDAINSSSKAFNSREFMTVRRLCEDPCSIMRSPDQSFIRVTRKGQECEKIGYNHLENKKYTLNSPNFTSTEECSQEKPYLSRCQSNVESPVFGYNKAKSQGLKQVDQNKSMINSRKTTNGSISYTSPPPRQSTHNQMIQTSFIPSQFEGQQQPVNIQKIIQNDFQALFSKDALESRRKLTCKLEEFSRERQHQLTDIAEEQDQIGRKFNPLNIESKSDRKRVKEEHSMEQRNLDPGTPVFHPQQDNASKQNGCNNNGFELNSLDVASSNCKLEYNDELMKSEIENHESQVNQMLNSTENQLMKEEGNTSIHFDLDEEEGQVPKEELLQLNDSQMNVKQRGRILIEIQRPRCSQLSDISYKSPRKEDAQKNESRSSQIKQEKTDSKRRRDQVSMKKREAKREEKIEKINDNQQKQQLEQQEEIPSEISQFDKLMRQVSISAKKLIKASNDNTDIKYELEYTIKMIHKFNEHSDPSKFKLQVEEIFKSLDGIQQLAENSDKVVKFKFLLLKKQLLKFLLLKQKEVFNNKSDAEKVMNEVEYILIQVLIHYMLAETFFMIVAFTLSGEVVVNLTSSLLKCNTDLDDQMSGERNSEQMEKLMKSHKKIIPLLDNLDCAERFAYQLANKPITGSQKTMLNTIRQSIIDIRLGTKIKKELLKQPKKFPEIWQQTMLGIKTALASFFKC